jgi:protein-tyrosine phosphatase
VLARRGENRIVNQLPVAFERVLPLDVSRVAPGVYQGSRPPPGDAVRAAGFNVLVLAAQEYQPPDRDFHGVRVIRAIVDDAGAPMTRREWQQALLAAGEAAALRARGARVLTTCHAGLNRSGLVNALMLHRLTGMSGRQAIDMVRTARPGALNNQFFTGALRQLPRRGR